jgi:hypothetical protein
MAYVKISTHFQDGLARLIEQHKDKVNIASLVEIFCNRIQGLEDELELFATKKPLPFAENQQLDDIATDLGIMRAGDDDETLRLRCYAQIAIYWSSGREEQISQIIKLLTGVEDVRVVEEFPASVSVVLETDETINTALKNVIENSLAIGVSLTDVIISPTDYFGFDSDPEADGFATLASSVDGGKWSVLL